MQAAFVTMFQLAATNVEFCDKCYNCKRDHAAKICAVSTLELYERVDSKRAENDKYFASTIILQ